MGHLRRKSMNQRGNMGALADQTLMDAIDNNSIAYMTDVFTSPGLVIGSSSTAAVKIANTTTFKILGKFYSKTTAEIAFTAGAASNVANGSEQCFCLQLDIAGNGLLIPGVPSVGQGTADLPERPGITLVSTSAAIVANAAAQTVLLNNCPNNPFNGVNCAVGSTVLVDFGGQQESVVVTAIVPGVSISGIFANNHPAGTLIQQGFCPIGSVRVWNASGSVFTAGTTALSASGITTSYTSGFPFPTYQTIF
jgi:hypothetical protein